MLYTVFKKLESGENELNQVSEHSPAGQKVLGSKGLLLYLVLLTSFLPLSIDLYLPALPTMSKLFSAPEVLTNLTIVLFFLFYSVSTLVWGPLSDKYGRRPILLSGLGGFAAASLLCALSPNVYFLIAARILQSLGAAAATATAMAVTKDVYTGRSLEKKIAAIQMISVVCPVAAPMLGALILRFISWRGTFLTQAAFGAATFLLTILFTETNREKSLGNILRTMGKLAVVLRGRRFTVLLVIFSLCGLPFMAFLSVSPYIYQNTFGLSSQSFSYFFALNAAMMFFGPPLYVWLSSRFSRFSLINLSFAVTVAAGLLVIGVGRLGPVAMTLSFLPATVISSFAAPPGMYLMLSESQDSGTASSLINAFGTVTGSIGMLVTSLAIGNLVVLTGAVTACVGLVCGFLWLFCTGRPFMKDLRDGRKAAA